MKIDWYRLLPRYWFQNYDTNWEWDQVLNEVLDSEPEVKVNYCTTKLGSIEVWTENYPYAYGRLYKNMDAFNFLPSVKTRKRLRRYIESYTIGSII